METTNKENMNMTSRFISRLAERKLISLIIIAIVIAGGYGVYEKFFHLTDAERAQKELVAAVAAVSKHMMLPEGDDPVLATVTDAEALSGQQAFFAGAINGDQLLLFPRNMKAMLYSPSRKMLVNVGPIEQSATGEQSPTVNSAPQESAAIVADPKTALTIEIRNGTGKIGYAGQVAEQISANAGYSVIKIADAEKKDYGKTIVFNRSRDDNKKTKVDALVNTFNAELVSEQPSGEKETTADVLVILGGN